ncbi:hypothetical protein [Streptomyces sp. NPDC057616]|uniref:hypothetical protein n=1 Tax=Streptomyces sp. NPDC057616 TaxID=3346183 RepID=UPI0036BE0D8C
MLPRAGLSDDAHSVAVDVIRRARMLTALPVDYFDVLVAPIIDKVSQHRPLSAAAWPGAAMVVAVRNSCLEDFHVLSWPLRAAADGLRQTMGEIQQEMDTHDKGPAA